MRSSNNTENEFERRLRVAREKMAGALIEFVEKMRVKPVFRSIIFRLFFLYNSVYEFQKTVKSMGVKVDPLKTIAPSFTKEQTNLLINTYNSIINDIRSHLAKKDSYVKEFSPLKELDEPTINEIAKTLFIMGINISQILSYMLRWTE